MILATAGLLWFCALTAWPFWPGGRGSYKWYDLEIAAGLCPVLGPVVPALLLSYVLRIGAIRFTRRWRSPSGRKALEGGRRRWLIAPVCLLLMLSVLIHRWPTVVVFQFRRPFLDVAAREFRATAGTTSIRCPSSQFGTGRLVLLADGRIKAIGMGGIGLVHDPSPPSPLPPNYVCRLGWGWYARDWR